MFKTMITIIAALLFALVTHAQPWPTNISPFEYQSPQGCWTEPGVTYQYGASSFQLSAPAGYSTIGGGLFGYVVPMGSPGYFFDPSTNLYNVVTCNAQVGYGVTSKPTFKYPIGKVSWNCGGTLYSNTGESIAEFLFGLATTHPFSLAAGVLQQTMFCEQIEGAAIRITDAVSAPPALLLTPPPLFTNPPPSWPPTIGPIPPTFAPPIPYGPIIPPNWVLPTNLTIYPPWIPYNPPFVPTNYFGPPPAKRIGIWASTIPYPSSWTLSCSNYFSPTNTFWDTNWGSYFTTMTNQTIVSPPQTNAGPLFWRSVVDEWHISPLKAAYVINVPAYSVVGAANQLEAFMVDYSLAKHFQARYGDYFIAAGTNDSDWPEWDCGGSNYWSGDSMTVLTPGRGTWFGSVEATNVLVMFEGAVPIGTNDLAIHAGRNMLCWPRPEPCNPSANGMPTRPGDIVSVWSPTLFDFVRYTNRAGAWSPALPTLNVGEPFMLDTTNASTWPIWFYDPILYTVQFNPAATVTNVTFNCANGLTHQWTNGPAFCCLGDQLLIQDSRMSLNYTNLDVGSFTGTDLINSSALFSGDLLLSTPYATRWVITKPYLATPPDGASITNSYFPY